MSDYSEQPETFNNANLAREVEELQKALSCGYTPAPGNLQHGEALQVEDLDVTLKLVTFHWLTYMTVHQLRRLIRNLQKRGIDYKLEEYLSEEFPWCLNGVKAHQADLYVGDRKLWINLGA